MPVLFKLMHFQIPRGEAILSFFPMHLQHQRRCIIMYKLPATSLYLAKLHCALNWCTLGRALLFLSIAKNHTDLSLVTIIVSTCSFE